ncbi:hypothetical protein J6590_026083 [Homalodisca vitripennis]|nr:hypothetical protein J6590_026083 [Homalodisca vitripennis]
MHWETALSAFILCTVCQVTAFDDTALQLALDVADKTIVQTLFKREGNQEVFIYINKYRQLISQVIRIFRQIDIKSWGKVKNLLLQSKIFNASSFPKISFNKYSFKEKLMGYGFNQEKIKQYMPWFSRNIKIIQKKLESLGLNEDRVNRIRVVMSDVMYLMSKVYTVFIYLNMLLKGTVFPQLFAKSGGQTTELAIVA